MKKRLIIFFVLFLFLPFNCLALSSDYKDRVSSITNSPVDENKINLYLFHGKECPHCEEERKWLKIIKEDYKDYLNIYYFEVWHDDENAKMMEKVSDEFDLNTEGVPLTVIGDKYFVGFSEVNKEKIESQIKNYAELENNPNEVKLPLLGKVSMKNVSIPLVAIILGFIDGFNPCAMWILLFLINMLFRMKNKKRAWILGFTFLFVSAFVYFLSMLGINFVIGYATIKYMKVFLGLFILVAGILNLRKYLKERKEEAGCTVVDDKKRKKLINRMRKIIDSKSFILSLVGIIILAASVNLIELACSLGFPVIFTELLTINEVTGVSKIIYLLIYIFFYMIDDIVVFSVSMITVEATGITNKYNKLCTLVSSIIMLVMGVLLLFKPEWLMLNF